MANYVISTESTCDLPVEYLEQESIMIHKLNYEIDGVRYKDGDGLSSKEFYAKVREGSMPITSQVNPDEAAENFRKALEEGKDILHISFSSSLSGTYQSMNIAKNDLEEDFPDRKIIIIDSLSASLGQGLLVYYATQKAKEGMNIDELASWVEDNKLRIAHDFTVDDLMHLCRGGRVSKGTAIVGGALGIKPVLHMSDDGRLEAVGKERGRKKSLIALAKKVVANIEGYEKENKVFTICHGDCIEEAEFVRDKILSLAGDKLDNPEFIFNYIGTVIGSHAGCGTIGVFSIGKGRNI